MTSSTTAVPTTTPTATKRGKLSLPEKREFIKARIKRGDLTRVAKKMEVKPSFVYYVINGDGRHTPAVKPRKNHVQVLNAAYALVYGRKG